MLTNTEQNEWNEIIGVPLDTWMIRNLGLGAQLTHLENDFKRILPMREKLKGMDSFEQIAYKNTEKAIKEKIEEIKKRATELRQTARKRFDEKRADQEAAQKEFYELMANLHEIEKTLEPMRIFFEKIRKLEERMDSSVLSGVYNPATNKCGLLRYFRGKALTECEILAGKPAKEVFSCLATV